MIVLRRVDVNKKPFRLIEIPDFIKCDPASVNCREQVQRSPSTCFDQRGRTLAARFYAIERSERLRTSILLYRHYSVMVQPQRSEALEEFGSHKRKITSDDNGPFAIASCESSVNAS